MLLTFWCRGRFSRSRIRQVWANWAAGHFRKGKESFGHLEWTDLLRAPGKRPGGSPRYFQSFCKHVLRRGQNLRYPFCTSHPRHRHHRKAQMQQRRRAVAPPQALIPVRPPGAGRRGRGRQRTKLSTEEQSSKSRGIVICGREGGGKSGMMSPMAWRSAARARDGQCSDRHPGEERGGFACRLCRPRLDGDRQGKMRGTSK